MGTGFLRALALTMVAMAVSASLAAQETSRTDLLAFAEGVIPVAIEGAASRLGVGMEQALRVIDGDDRGFNLTPKPGGPETEVVFVYRLPAATVFDAFAVPNVLETPSPSQTFVRTVTLSGSLEGPDGPFLALAEATLATHPGKGETTAVAAHTRTPVRWLRVQLSGGIHVEREKTFLEFSELKGFGTQEAVPLSQAFGGRWQGRGVMFDLEQDGVRVSGCYDRDGELTGTVSGNILRATGKTRQAGIPGVFVLSTGDRGEIIGVCSTNGAPFRLCTGEPAPAAPSGCRRPAVRPVGCGSIVHGIEFAFDSATLRPEAEVHLETLHAGLSAATAGRITVVGHTSSEGPADYNLDLSRRRAAAVAAAMIARGIDPPRIAAEGRGEDEPIADNATAAGRALNRRVEIACR